MKLKKLLPLAGITGIAAIAAPLVTSCANKGTIIKWSKSDGEAGLPDVGHPTKTTFKTLDEATDAYFDAIKDDKSLLSKEILLSNYYSSPFSDINEMSAQTDKVDAKNHKVSFTNKVTTKTLGFRQDYVYEAKNAEFCITIFDVEIGEYQANVPVFMPKLMLEVVNAWYLIQESSPEASKAVQIAMDHAEDLANDNSWYFYTSSEDEDAKLSQRIDSSNVYEYAYTMAQDILWGDDISLADFPVWTTYFEEIHIEG